MLVSRSFNPIFSKCINVGLVALNKRLFHTRLIRQNYGFCQLTAPANALFMHRKIGVSFVPSRSYSQETEIKDELKTEEVKETETEEVKENKKESQNEKSQKIRDYISQGQTEVAMEYFKMNPSMGGAINLVKYYAQNSSEENMKRGLEVSDTLHKACILENPKFISYLMYLCNPYEPNETISLYRDMKKKKMAVDNHTFPKISFAAVKLNLLDVAIELLNVLKSNIPFKVSFEDCRNLLTVFGNHQRYKDAHDVMLWMEKNGVKLDSACYRFLLNACNGHAGISTGKLVQSSLSKSEFGSDTTLLQHLAEMLASQNNVDSALAVMSRISPNIIEWNRLITRCVDNHYYLQALNLFDKIPTTLSPSDATYNLALTACFNLGTTALERGKQIHAQIKERNINTISVYNAVMQMYTQCGEPQTTLQVYDEIVHQQKATPNHYTFVNALSAIGKIGSSALEKGKEVHKDIITHKVDGSAQVISWLTQMYEKCGDLKKAVEVGDSGSHAPTRANILSSLTVASRLGEESGDLVEKIYQQMTTYKFDTDPRLVGSLIKVYNKSGNPSKAIEVFDNFVEKKGKLDDILLNNVLNSIAQIGPSALPKGKQIHELIKKKQINRRLIIVNALLRMYNKCGDQKAALDLYAGHVSSPTNQTNYVTLANVLRVCANIGPTALDKGKAIHQEAIKRELESNPMVDGALKEMYEKCEK
eukprot:TRINITY_DN3069_c0_g8_i1.p1 TRINITY_DN3069_c0_g8~~TRINITY_DN3069_c0_g8_i1.p1  ORF type:complete len:705 (+),score=142.11 TRINITY_DN3069_c0_g8_i1:295-2409(+)